MNNNRHFYHIKLFLDSPISRGELSEQTRRHETIHFKQWLELLIIGFAILYIGSWAWLRFIKGYDGQTAYRMIPFEQEAYDNQGDKRLRAKRWVIYFKVRYWAFRLT